MHLHLFVYNNLHKELNEAQKSPPNENSETCQVKLRVNFQMKVQFQFEDWVQ